MDSLVSVIVPIYNVEKYLEECLDSICNQTYSNLEIILINDGSTDNSYDICKDYEGKDRRIILINQENKGVSAARNVGLAKAQGEYITFVDSDDYVDVTYIETLISYAKEDIDIICCNVDGYGKDILLEKRNEIAEVFTNSGYTWGKMIRKKIIKSNFCESICYAEDYIFYISMLKNINKLQVINYDGYMYRIRPGSLSVKDKQEKPSVKEFNNKYTFTNSEEMLDNIRNEQDCMTKDVIDNHCYYIYTLIMLLRYRVKNKDVVQKKTIKMNMRKCKKAFARITLMREKNIKRYMFGILLYHFPNLGGKIADKLL